MAFSDHCLDFILAFEKAAGELSDAAREEAADGDSHDVHVDAIGRLAARVAHGIDDASGGRDADAVGRLFALAEAVMHARCAPPPHSDGELEGVPDELRRELVEDRQMTMALYRRADALAADELRPPFPPSAPGLDGPEIDASSPRGRRPRPRRRRGAHGTVWPAKTFFAHIFAHAAAAEKDDDLRRSIDAAAAEIAGLCDAEAERVLERMFRALDLGAGARR